MMKSQYLKTKIQTYLDDTTVLTDGEVNELLFDCLCYFEEQDQKRSQFKKTYEGIMSNARQQQVEAAEMLKGFGQLSEILRKVQSEAKSS